jgi:hypothetical protein
MDPFSLNIINDKIIHGRIFSDAPAKERQRKAFRLPVVVPIVLYNGADEWTVVRSFKEYLNDYALFGSHVIDFDYILLDVNKFGEQQLLEQPGLVDTVFFLDQQYPVDISLQRLTTALHAAKELSLDQQGELVDWLRGVFPQKIIVDHRTRKRIDEIIDSFEMGDENAMTYAIERMFAEFREKSTKDGKMLSIVELIDKKRAKNKTREQIIDELELDEAGIDLLDNLETYREKLAEDSVIKFKK